MKISKIIKFIFNSDYRFVLEAEKGKHADVEDRIYLERFYHGLLNKKLNLDNPKTFNEKLQWLKLYDRKDIYTTMVDKYSVKEYVAGIIGEQYIIPTLGVWEKFDQINFDNLPNQFVLKCTHDSGGLVVCRDKSVFNKEEARKKINKSLQRNFYYSGREWPYKNVPPRIIAEEYMEDSQSKELRDYKFFCFNGKVKFLYLSQGLENHNTARISFVTLDWKVAPFHRKDYPPFEQLPPKPKNFEEMIKLAEILSKGIPHARIDFYDVNDKILFGEITLFSGSGFTEYTPEIWDKKIGEWLVLPSI